MSWREYIDTVKTLLHKSFSDDIFVIKMIVTILVIVMFFMIVVPSFLLAYPFKTVEFVGNPPIQILNPAKRVPNGAVVRMRVSYIKYVDTPALVVRTLVRTRNDGTIVVLDSSTIMSFRPRGNGVTEPTFLLTLNPNNIGSDCRLVFSMSYTLYGFRHVTVQYISEPFEIFQLPEGTPCPPGHEVQKGG